MATPQLLSHGIEMYRTRHIEMTGFGEKNEDRSSPKSLVSHESDMTTTYYEANTDSYEKNGHKQMWRPLISHESGMPRTDHHNTDLNWEIVKGSMDIAAPLISQESKLHPRDHNETTDSYEKNGHKQMWIPLFPHESGMPRTDHHNTDLNWERVKGSLDIAAPLISQESKLHPRDHNETTGCSWNDEYTDATASSVPHKCQIHGRSDHRTTGFGKFKVEVTALLTRKIILDLATLFEYPNGLCDDLMNAKDGVVSHRMVSEMEGRGQISATDISPLIEALHSQELKGIAGKVTKAFFENLSGAEGYHHMLPLSGREPSDKNEERPSECPFFSPLNPDPFAEDDLSPVANNPTYQSYSESTDKVYLSKNASITDESFYQKTREVIESGNDATRTSECSPSVSTVVDNPTYQSENECGASTAKTNQSNAQPFYQNSAEVEGSQGDVITDSMSNMPETNGMRDDPTEINEAGYGNRIQTNRSNDANHEAGSTDMHKMKYLLRSPSNLDSSAKDDMRSVPNNPINQSSNESTDQGKSAEEKAPCKYEPIYQNTTGALESPSDAAWESPPTGPELIEMRGALNELQYTICRDVAIKATRSRSKASMAPNVVKDSPEGDSGIVAQAEDTMMEAPEGKKSNIVKIANEVSQFRSYLESVSETLLSFNDEVMKHVRSRTEEYAHRIDKEEEQMKNRIAEIANTQREEIANDEQNLRCFLEERSNTFHEKVEQARHDLDENFAKPLIDEHGYTQLIQYQKLTQKREGLERALTEMKNVIHSLLRAYTPPSHLIDVMDPFRRMVKVFQVAVQRLQVEQEYRLTGIAAVSSDRLLLTSCKLHSGKVALELVDIRGNGLGIKRFEEKSFRGPMPLYATAINKETIVVGWSNILFTMIISTMKPLSRIEIDKFIAAKGARISCLSVDMTRGTIAVGTDKNSIIHIFNVSLEYVASVSPINGGLEPPISLSWWNGHLLACDGVESAILTDEDGKTVARFKPPENGLAPMAIDMHDDCAYLLWHNTAGQISRIQCYALTGSGVTPVGKPEFVSDDTKFLITMPSSNGYDRLVAASQRGNIAVYRVLDEP